MNELTSTTPTPKPETPAFSNVATLAAAGIIGAGLIASSPARAVSPALTFDNVRGAGDTKVLNFALILEDLETELYVQALQRLTTGGRGGRDAAPGTNIPGLGLSSNLQDVLYTREFSRIERQHRDFLRGALGAQAVSPFKFAFNMAQLSRQQTINLIYTAEMTGVGAYLGAIPFFTGQNKDLLRIAAAIQGTEARHTAIFADLLNDLFGAPLNVAPLFNQNRGIDVPVPPNTVLQAVSPFIVL